MHRWSKIRDKLENEYLAESLKGRIRYFATTYNKAHDNHGRAAILLDGKEILSGDYFEQYLKAYLLPNDDTLETRLSTKFFFMDDTSLKLGMFDQTCFYKAFSEFDNQSIDLSLKSEDLIVRIFALFDKRTGKRTLAKIGEHIADEPEIFQQFYKIRMDAENDVL